MSNRCGSVVKELTELLDELEVASGSARARDKELSDELLYGIE